MSATPFLTVSGTLSALPSAPPGNVWILMRPPENCSSLLGEGLAPISISGPPGHPVAIFQL